MKPIKIHPILLWLLLIWIPISIFFIWTIIPKITISIILLLLLVLWIPISAFLIWNDNKKLNKFENWATEYINKIIEVQSNLKAIDSSGSFASDDETGIIFNNIKQIVNSLNKLIIQK